MIHTIGTLSDDLAQYSAAQARFYIASLYDIGLLERNQFDELMAANVKALNDWETHPAGMDADGQLNDRSHDEQRTEGPDMAPETALQHVREDIAEMRTAPTHSSCDRLHVAVHGYCRALLDCGVISKAQFVELMAEAAVELANWQGPTVPLAEWRG